MILYVIKYPTSPCYWSETTFRWVNCLDEASAYQSAWRAWEAVNRAISHMPLEVPIIFYVDFPLDIAHSMMLRFNSLK